MYVLNALSKETETCQVTKFLSSTAKYLFGRSQLTYILLSVDHINKTTVMFHGFIFSVSSRCLYYYPLPSLARMTD